MAASVLITSELEAYIASLRSYLNREPDDEKSRGGIISHGPEPNAKPEQHLKTENDKDPAHCETKTRQKDHRTKQSSTRDKKKPKPQPESVSSSPKLSQKHYSR